MRRTLRTYSLPLLIGLLALIFFYKLAFTGMILGRGDTFAYFYPYWDVRNAALSAGEIPFWSNTLFMGVPLLANSQVGVWYPPNGLTIPFDAPDAIRVSILIHGAWGMLGAWLLARHRVGLGRVAAWISAVIFAFGGHVGAHVEQINQLQGLSWMPFLFLLAHLSRKHPLRWVPIFGAAWAMQLLAGHTQTAFITGIGLGMDALISAWMTPDKRRFFRFIGQPAQYGLLLALAVILAVIFALPQLVPTQELIAISNRGGGLNPQEATAFSLDPLMAGRGLLPSYDGQPFGEFVAYLGVVGVGLMALGIAAKDTRRWVWLILAGIGLAFAFGRYNPLYWGLAHWPGFNLFRVPARWLALFALGGAMLAGIGAESLWTEKARLRAGAGLALAVILTLAIGAFLAESGVERITGEAKPTAITVILWLVAAGGLAGGVILLRHNPRDNRRRVGLAALVVAELWIASNTLPYNNLIDPAVYREQPFMASQLHALNEGQTVPGRLLTITAGNFQPGDEAALNARWDALGLDENARAIAFAAVKWQGMLGGNLALTWDIATIDGFDGGILPTFYYTAFSSLLLPQGSLRTTDGRLRERLALADCRGACLPDEKWLDLTDTRYVLVDKVFDLVHEGVFFDTLFERTLDPAATYPNVDAFTGDRLDLLYVCDEAVDCPPSVDGLTLDASGIDTQGVLLARYSADEPFAPEHFTLTGEGVTVIALSWVDARTGDFVQLVPEGWRRLYSADLKLYENLETMPRAFVVAAESVGHVPDDWRGADLAVQAMALDTFDPAESAIIHDGDSRMTAVPQAIIPAEIIEYDDTRVVIEATAAGYLILSDAYHPRWSATVNGTPATVYAANGMFRAVPVPENSTVVMAYTEDSRLAWLALLSCGLFPVMLTGGFSARMWRRKRIRRSPRK